MVRQRNIHTAYAAQESAQMAQRGDVADSERGAVSDHGADSHSHRILVGARSVRHGLAAVGDHRVREDGESDQAAERPFRSDILRVGRHDDKPIYARKQPSAYNIDNAGCDGRYFFFV